MTKEEILSQLRAAKAAHINWVQRAKMLIAGVNIREDSIPVNSTECKFGQWFYSDGQILNNIRNNPSECMSEVETLHFKLHDVYLNIFTIFYTKEKKGFFAKVFGNKNKVNDADRKRASEYFLEMEKISKELIDNIDRMERRIFVISDAEIESLK